MALLHQINNSMRKIVLIIGICLSMVNMNAQFTTGRIVVLQVGDSVALSNAGTQMSLVEFTTTGTPGFVVNIPATGAGQHVMSGTATSEGLITLSTDQTKLIIPGYSAPEGTAGIAATTSATVSRAIATVTASGVYTQSVLTNSFYSANNIRSACSDGTGNFWATGGNTGYCYLGTGTPAIVSSSPLTNLRAASIVLGNLTYSTSSGTNRGIYQITGTPITGPQTATLVVNTGSSSSPFQYAANFASNVVYIADDRSTATGGGIQKWVFSGSWTLAYTLDCGNSVGARGLIADFSGTNPVLYVTTADGTNNRLIKFTDAGAGSPFTLLATAPNNTAFRGLAFSPNSTPPPTPTVSLSVSTNAGSEAGTTVVRVRATTSAIMVSNQTVSVGVSGAGITAGDYTLSNSTITINAGFDTASVSFTVVDDALVEGTETATLTISSPSSGLTLGSPTSQNITITDNDLAPPTVHFTSLHQSVLENAGTASVGFTMTTTPNASPCRVVVTTSVHTTATGGGTDYSIANDTVTFPAGSSTPQNLVVNINNDALVENAEYISFKVASIINGTLGTNQYHILYIRDNDYTPPTPTNEVMLQLLTSYSNGAEGSNSAEIVAYDPGSQKLVIANSIGGKLDIVNFSNPSAPGPINSINITSLGNINSVAVKNGIIAVALENLAPQSNGKILFYNMSGVLVSQVDAGAMPDMITFNNAGTKVYAACEGEPNTAYTLDPEGSITAVDISGGVATVTNANVTHINFNAYDSQIASLRAAGVRIYGNNGAATVSQDVEPEYITISDNDSTAWVSLQENNALAVVNLITNTVTQILPLGTVNHTLTSNGLDASDQSSGINIANYPVKGMFMPDAITHMKIGGTNYIFTANEGDSRAYSGFNEESRISSITLDPTAFPDQNILKSNFFLGRLNATTKTGDTDNDGDIDQLHVYGARGFSVWSETGTLLFNSGNLLEQITANHPTFSTLFNASNTSGAAVAKNRSDDKGPEIEGVAVANIDGDNYLFASAERIGGVFVFNIDIPTSPKYVGYYNNRAFATNGPDRGAEGIIYISAAQSPNGNDLVILANEVSSTLSIYQVNTCASLSNVNISVSPNDTICAGGSANFSTTVGANTNLQWLYNNANIVGATGTSTTVNQAGAYSLAVQNTALACTDTTASRLITVLSNPVASIAITDTVACLGQQLTLDASGGTPTWNNGISDNTPFTPTVSDMYVVSVANAFGCVGLDSVQVIVNALPNVGATVNDNDICAGTSVTFNGTNATTYTWNNGVTNNVPFTPAATNTYTVTGTDANLCSNTATVTVTVHVLPIVVASVSDNDVCAGTSVTFNGLNAVTYVWNNGVTDNVPFTPASTNTYTVTGTDANLCSNTATVTVTVNALPNVGASVTDNDICLGASVIFNGSNAVSYSWSNGVTNNVSFTPSTTNTYTVTGTDANLCSNTATVTVTVNPLPNVIPNVTDNNICLGESVIFTGSNATSYTWNNGVTDGVSFNPAATNTYTVTGTDANTCTNTATITVTVNPLPTLVFSIAADSVCTSYAPISLSATPVGGAFSGTGVVGTTFNPAVGTGNYTITYTYTDVNGCTNTANDNLLVSGCLDIYNQVSNDLLIYPNPTENYIYIKSTINLVYNLEIVDMHGRTVLTTLVSDADAIDVSYLSAGTYQVILTNNQMKYTSKLIKK
jgi:hypothetical protein